MIKSLKLFLVNPQPPMAIISPQEFIAIKVDVSGENIEECFVSIKYDTNYFELVEGAELYTLGSGSFLKQLSWLLKAIKISYNPLWTEIIAKAGDLFQAAGFNIKVIKNKES